YSGLAERLERFALVFGAGCTRIGLAIRPYEDFWASSMAYAIKAGHPVVDQDGLDRLVTQPRNWRRVVCDVAAAFPKAEVTVWEFGRLIGRPQAQYRLLAGKRGRLRNSKSHHNASPKRDALREILMLREDQTAVRSVPAGDGAYMPFGTHHLAAFQAQYADDLTWLRSRPKTDFNFIEKLGPELAARRFAGE
ncbi:MAG: hypothetical protein ACI8YI_002620, partial [Paracoccaceae bacterium]